MGCYGYEAMTSPLMDEFARKGTLFRHAYAPSPWTLPSHVSLFTGLYTDSHGVSEENVTLKKDADTLAARLGRNGYQTGAIVCAPLLRPDFGVHHGFDVYDTELIADSYVEARLVKVGPSVTAKALKWIDGRDARPFFLFLHYWDVHYDYNPPEEYLRLFDPDYDGDINGIDIYNRTDIVPGMDPRDLEHLIALYDAEIRYTDDAIGSLLNGLAERGLDANTMIWLTSDHGEEFLEHGGKGHTTTCYEELIRVPLLARVPWLDRPQSVVEGPVSLIDLYPTILELLEIRDGDLLVQGKSLAAAMKGEAPIESRYVMAQTMRGKRHQSDEKNLIWTSLVDGERLKLHQLQAADEEPDFLLFDLNRDEAEQRDLSANDRARAASLVQELLLRQKKHQDMKTIVDMAIQQGLDPELIEMLKGLGYLQ
jgi:arylsulfatase